MKDFKRGDYVTTTYYELVFDDGCGNGFCFPCEKDGTMTSTNPGAVINHKWCLENPDKFFRFNKVIKREKSWRENNSGVCDCGNRIELYNEYLGACECPYCGQWWNIWGQALNNPSTWSDGDDW